MHAAVLKHNLNFGLIQPQALACGFSTEFNNEIAWGRLD